MAGAGGKNCSSKGFNNKMLDEIFGVQSGSIKLTLFNDNGTPVSKQVIADDIQEDQHTIDFGTATESWGTVTFIRVTLPVGLTFDIPLIFARTINANDSIKFTINRDELIEASKQAELAKPSPRRYSMPDIGTHVDTTNNLEYYKNLELKDDTRCEITHNPCGTDTWIKDHPCGCANCQAWLANHTMAKIAHLPDKLVSVATWDELKKLEELTENMEWAELDLETEAKNKLSAVSLHDLEKWAKQAAEANRPHDITDWPTFELCPNHIAKPTMTFARAIRAATREDGSLDLDLATLEE